ncbi:MAG TPA: hypothetical protein VGQ44_21970 [Gemmatimonadaceae bacterium]|nr:hypothetical protein [Gemmatimonadaceae bacterium]
MQRAIGAAPIRVVATMQPAQAVVRDVIACLAEAIGVRDAATVLSRDRDL